MPGLQNQKIHQAAHVGTVRMWAVLFIQVSCTFCAWKSHNGTWLCLLESEKSVIAVSRIHSSGHTPNISPILLFYPPTPPSSVPAATYPVPHTQYVRLLSLWSYAEPYSRLFPLPYTRSYSLSSPSHRRSPLTLQPIYPFALRSRLPLWSIAAWHTASY